MKNNIFNAHTMKQMSTRSIIISLGFALLLLAACSSSSEPGVVAYKDLPPSSLTPPNGMAQIVFYYPYSYFWDKKSVNIVLNGQKTCSLKSGNFVIKNVQPAPRNSLVISMCGGIATSSIILSTLPNTTYYIRMIPHDDNTVTGLLAKYGLSEFPQNHKEPEQNRPSTQPLAPPIGPFVIDVMSPENAAKELESLTSCTHC